MYNRLGEMDYVQRNSTECREAAGEPSHIIWDGRWKHVKDLPNCDGLLHHNPLKCPVIVIFGHAIFFFLPQIVVLVEDVAKPHCA